MKSIFTARRLELILITLVLAVPSGGAVYFIKQNRYYDLSCWLMAYGEVAPYYLSYSEKMEIASAGNERWHRWKQEKLIYTYSNAKWGVCLPYDEDKFHDFVDKMAALGWAEAQYVYAISRGRIHQKRKQGLFLRRSLPAGQEDIRGSFSHLLRAAKNGHRAAQHLLSASYAAGRWGDLSTDYDVCRPDQEVLQRSPKHAGVLCSYTDTVVNGKWGAASIAIDKDEAQSIVWLERAINTPSSGRDIAELRDKDLKYDLATRYRYGKYGAVQDYERALTLFSELAAGYQALGGDARAMAQLAWMYVEEAGAERDMDTARYWMKQALENAHTWAAINFYQAAYNKLAN